MRGFLFGWWKLGEGVVLLRFLWGFRILFLKRFIGLFGCVGADVFGIVLRCQKGQGWTTRTEILCFLLAATWWRAVGGQDRTKGAFGGCLTLTLQPM